MELTDEQELVR